MEGSVIGSTTERAQQPVEEVNWNKADHVHVLFPSMVEQIVLEIWMNRFMQ